MSYVIENRHLKRSQQQEPVPEMMEYSVKGSDTLASIALKFNTTTSKLARMNRLSSRLLYPGQTLFVPVKIDLFERQNRKDELELVTQAPKARPFPGRQGSFSPDHQMEELLKKDDNGKDVVSAKYLRINGRYITDGQGVVPGVLLVTPQTIMFNPSVSDHLVIDRGRDAYTVRAPMKAIKNFAYYHDITALVLGDTSAEFIPVSVTPKHNHWQQQLDVTMDTSNYVSQDTVGMLSMTQASDTKGRDSAEPMSLDESTFNLDNSRTGDNSAKQTLSQDSEFSVDMSQDETSTNCSCPIMSQDGAVSNEISEMDGNSVSNSSSIEGTSSSIGIFTNHDRTGKKERTPIAGFKGNIVRGSNGTVDNTSYIKQDFMQKNAETTRESIDIIDTKCTSTPRKVQENTIKNSKVGMHDDSGLIYTKIKPRNSVKILTGNAIRLESSERKNGSSGNIAGKIPANSFSEGESMTHIDASRDSGISEGSSFQSTKSNIGTGSVKEEGTNDPMMSPGGSSLSNEAREWLGKRGIRFNSASEDEGNFSETIDGSNEEFYKPRPASISADELVYLCLRVKKGYWCRPSPLQTHIMGIPQNRDQERMEHWFAVPETRLNQLHTFFTSWKSTVKPGSDILDDSFRTSEGLSIVDDTFARPSAEELLIDRFEQAKRYAEPYKEGYYQRSPNIGSRKSTLSSLTDDDVPELTDESNIMENMQIAAINEALKGYQQSNTCFIPRTSSQHPGYRLSRELPSRTIGHRWNLVYSTAVHGISLKTLYRNTQDIESPILLVVVDQDGKTFGAFMSDPPKISEGFYGTGESMLFTFKEKKIKAYRWTGTNSFFIKGDSQCLSIGGGDGMFGLWLDEDLNHGRSHSCKTFDNETLSSKEDFTCRGLEAWSFE